MADLVIANKDDLVSIANAIREKAESTDGLVFPAGFVEAISGIEAGGFFAEGEFTPANNISTDFILDIGYPTQSFEDWAPNGFLFFIYITTIDSINSLYGGIMDGYFNCESSTEYSTMTIYHSSMKKIMTYDNYIGRTDDKISIKATSLFPLSSRVTYYWKVVTK